MIVMVLEEVGSVKVGEAENRISSRTIGWHKQGRRQLKQDEALVCDNI